MALIVQKFGGTSVGSIVRIQHAASIIAKAHKNGDQVIVVVSAMQGETDRLIQLADEIALKSNSRDYARLISSGEHKSAALVALALQDKGIDAMSLSGKEAGVLTSDRYCNAIIKQVDVKNLKQLLSDNKIPVVTGFQGVNQAGDVTTLGRGGSDTSAVAIAAAMNVDECHIYTDVDGVYTSDPRIVSDARLIDHITYTEMLALSSLGAKVLHRQAVSFAKKHGVAVRVLSSFCDGPGTLITAQHAVKEPWVSGLAFDQSQAKLSILGIPKTLKTEQQLQEAIRQASFDVDMSVQNVSSQDTVDFSFTVHLEDYQQAVNFSHEVAKTVFAKEVLVNDKMAKLSVVGMGMKSHAGVASKVFQTLGSQGIDIYLIASTEAKISTIIDKAHMEASANLLHKAFHLEATSQSLLNNPR